MFLDIDGHCQHVALYGSENHPALVLLHSLGTCHAVWERQIRAFSKSHFVICPDFRGHGLSEVSRTPVTVEALAEDVVAILAAIGVNRFDLAGISIGGLVAQRVAATLREEVRTTDALSGNDSRSRRSREGRDQEGRGRLRVVRSASGQEVSCGSSSPVCVDAGVTKPYTAGSAG